MNKNIGERGGTNVLLLPVILLTLLFIVAVSFAVWAFGGRQDYKNNVDTKVAAAVAADKQVVQATDAKQYAEVSKSPLKTYTGPDAYGSVQISYPKTWSAYIDTTSSSTPLDAYFHDDYVPSVSSLQTYNLRVQVNTQSYDNVMTQYTPLIAQGVTAVPYSLPQEPKIIGTRFSGAVFPDKQGTTGTLILLPLRSTTLEIWTESNDYLSDFNNYILPNLNFHP